jgi:chemotaxis protein CheX
MMTSVSLKDVLLEAARDVFETMAFMALEEKPQEIAWQEEDCLLGSVTFKGNLEGCLSICCGIPCARAIAANMLGMESQEGLGETDVQDAVGELVDMLIGSVKSRIQDHVGTLDVSIPSVVHGRRLKTSVGEGASQVLINSSLEGRYPAVLSLLCRQTVA